MLNDRVQEALNQQLNAELYSAYLYLSMSSYFQATDLPGLANWTRVQAQEEQMHGLKIYDYINDRGGRVELLPIEGPPIEWDSPQSVFEQVYAHEQKVTGLINNLVHANGLIL